MGTPQDNNFVPVKMGILYTDGVTPVPIAIDAGGNMKVDTANTIAFTPEDVARRDENHVPVWMGVSSVDGTPMPIYVTAAGAVLVDT